MPLGMVLYESGETLRHIYFPTDSIVSLLYVMEDGASADAFRDDQAKLQQVRRDRAEAALRYFAAHADVWDSIRALHVAESEVERAIDTALGERPLGTLVDVGDECPNGCVAFNKAGVL